MNRPCQTARRLCIACALAVGVSFYSGCGHYPAKVSSRWGILWTSSSETMIVITDLPLEDWSGLQKFTELEHLHIGGQTTVGVEDAHLQVLSRLNMPKLRDLNLGNFIHITDDGIRGLTNLHSIESLGLREAGITDQGLLTIARGLPRLTALGVERCRSLTMAGFLTLTNAPHLDDVGMSVGDLTQGQVERIMTELGQVTYWGIDDKARRLSLEPFVRMKERRGLKITFRDGDCMRGVEELAKSGYETRMSR